MSRVCPGDVNPEYSYLQTLYVCMIPDSFLIRPFYGDSKNSKWGAQPTSDFRYGVVYLGMIDVIIEQDLTSMDTNSSHYSKVILSIYLCLTHINPRLISSQLNNPHRLRSAANYFRWLMTILTMTLWSPGLPRLAMSLVYIQAQPLICRLALLDAPQCTRRADSFQTLTNLQGYNQM